MLGLFLLLACPHSAPLPSQDPGSTWLPEERPNPWVLVGDAVDAGATPLLEAFEGEILPLDGPLPPSPEVVVPPEQRIRSARGHARRLLEGDPSRDLILVGVAGDPEDEAVLAWIREEMPERLRLAVLLGDPSRAREDALVASSWEEAVLSLVETGLIGPDVLGAY